MLSSKLQLVGAGIIAILVFGAGAVVGKWSAAADQLAEERKLQKRATELQTEVTSLQKQVSDLTLSLTNQTAAVTLLEEQSKSAKALQDEAKKRADALAEYSKQRLNKIDSIMSSATNCDKVLSQYWGVRP